MGPQASIEALLIPSVLVNNVVIISELFLLHWLLQLIRTTNGMCPFWAHSIIKDNYYQGDSIVLDDAVAFFKNQDRRFMCRISKDFF